MREERLKEALLILDTCGERGSVALFSGNRLVVEEILPERMASAALLGAVRRVLKAHGVRLADVGVVGVVNGPGSFTGLRVGLAVAKGLCEAAGIPLAAVSRLAVLAEAGGAGEGFAVLRAGRDQLYVREVRNGRPASERMMQVEDFLQVAQDTDTVFAEPEVAPMLGSSVLARAVSIKASDAVGLVRACVREGGSDIAAVDANYVRDERSIYRRALITATTGAGQIADPQASL